MKVSIISKVGNKSTIFGIGNITEYKKVDNIDIRRYFNIYNKIDLTKRLPRSIPKLFKRTRHLWFPLFHLHALTNKTRPPIRSLGQQTPSLAEIL